MTASVHNVNFHGVGAPPRELAHGERAVWLDSARFCATLDVLRDRDDIRISFDDGNRSDLDVALPSLLERGLTATFFVCAGWLGEPHFLGPAELLELRQAGMRIGSHGMHHRDWRRASDDELAAELAQSRQILEDVVGASVTEAAIPFGSYDRRVLTLARREAYDRIYTSDGGPARHDAWLQPRTTVSNDGVAPAALARAPSTWQTAERALKGFVKRWR